MKRISRFHRSDDGAMLIFALIIITTVALVTGAVLAKGWGSFAATVKLRNVAGQAYASDAAAKVAINQIQFGGSSTVPASVATYPNGAGGTPASWLYDNNTDGTGCFGRNASNGAALDRLTFPSVYPPTQSGDSSAQTATVVCTPVPGTGLFGSGNGAGVNPVSSTDPFSRALTTLGTGVSGSATDGITLKGLGAGTEIPFRGGIESKTFVNVTNGTLRTNGTVLVPNPANCSGSIIPLCTAGFVTPTVPASPLGSVPLYKDPATQGCTFQEGFYNNGAALSSAVNACVGFAGAHFLSGKYYFDFSDGNPWTINTTVIGGVLASGTSIPGRCVSPINSPSNAGVQFVFGGSSSVVLQDGASVELCGPSNSGAAPLTIFQQQTGSTPGSLPVGPVASSNVTFDGTGKNDPFKPASPASATLTNALSAPSNPTADWKCGKDGNTGELDLQNFNGLSGIPIGSTITSAKLKVTYTSGLTLGSTFTAAVAGQPGAVAVAASGVDTDITALLNAQFASGAFTATNPKIRLLIAGATKKNDPLSVDAATLAVQYTQPALRPATTPGDFISDLGGNFKGQFVVQGATYAPKGEINVVPGSTSAALVAFRWGVVAWGVNFKSQPSQTWGYPIVSIPDVGPGLGSAITSVDLKVFLCTGSGPCSTSGTPALSSRVQFTDPTDDDGVVNPVPGHRKVDILSWAEQR